MTKGAGLCGKDFGSIPFGGDIEPAMSDKLSGISSVGTVIDANSGYTGKEMSGSPPGEKGERRSRRGDKLRSPFGFRGEPGAVIHRGSNPELILKLEGGESICNQECGEGGDGG